MKNISTAFLILLFSIAAFAQAIPQKPLTQAEYVKMLYDLQKTPAKKDEIVEAVRMRGIAFELTDGLRGLTTSKSRNDAELKRTVEEAERRRQNPTSAKLPTEKESSEIIAKAREANLAAVEAMPDFTVKELVSRGMAYAGTNNWKSLDKLTVAVNYSTTKGEQYKVLVLNGVLVNAEAGRNYGGLGGATTSGEFVDDLNRTFKKESKTNFKLIDTDTVRGRKAVIYQFKIDIENSGNDGITSGTRENPISVPAGREGRIWVDRDTFRVLRIQFQSTDIPANFPVKKFESSTDFDWVEIGGEKYLLPVMSDARFTSASEIGLLQDRNVIRFKEYQKYGSEVKILDDDAEEPAPEEKPKP